MTRGAAKAGAVTAAMMVVCSVAGAQISLSSAVDLALRNDPKIKMARADVDKAKAMLSESKDAFVPAVSTSGGIGKSIGVPLAVPVVFSITAQSLVINFSQINYVRAADAGADAAGYALAQVESDVVQDTVNTYISLDNAVQRQKALREATDVSGRLVEIVQQRYDAGADPHIEVTKAKRTAAGIRLQSLQVDNEVDTLSEHLGHLLGLGHGVETVHDSIPDFGALPEATDKLPESVGMKAARATTLSKQYTTRGDSRYRLLPQVAFGAGYSRISTVATAYAQYYPGFDPDKHPGISYNSLDLGVQISVPLLDMLHQAKARASKAEAVRAQFEEENQRMQFVEGRSKALRSAKELQARAEIASLDRDLAQDRIDTIELQLKADAAATDGAQVMTPKDEQNARLDERLKYLDMLSAELQLKQTELTLMQQNGSMTGWMRSTISAQPASVPAPAVPEVTPPAPAGVNQPGVPGVPKPE